MREVLRQEKKYLINFEQFRKMDHRFSLALQPDTNNADTGYTVRSLYFDTIQERDFYEKEDGLEIRRKLRLRIYDPASAYALLEMKQKEGAYQKKRSLSLKREDAEALTRGEYSCLLQDENTFARECYGLMSTMFYRPKSIVEYRRKAYMAAENSTRITFDYEVNATESNFDLFSESLNMNPVLDSSLVIMEVKYSGFLLSYIKDMVSMEGKSPLSVSKYSLSRSTGLHYVF